MGCPWADGWRHYLPHAGDALHPYAAPGAAVRLAGLPQTLLLTAADDAMCDETRGLARRLREAGVPVDASVLPLRHRLAGALTASASRPATGLGSRPSREQAAAASWSTPSLRHAGQPHE